MSNDRCFRIDEFDIEELRDSRCDLATIHAYETWVQEYVPQLDDVIAAVSAAFSEVTLGDGVGLWEAQGLDDYASSAELKELREKDEKSDWRKISVEDLNQCHAAPSFMDPRGFVFHLPAFLIAELDDRHGYGFLDRLYSENEHPHGWSALLTEPQRKALIAALRLVQAHPNYEPECDTIAVKTRLLGSLEDEVS